MLFKLNDKLICELFVLFLLCYIPVHIVHAQSGIYGYNGTNTSIPDNGYVFAPLVISGVPNNAVVTGVDVYFSAIHPSSSDLKVALYNADYGITHFIWENEGGGASNPNRTVSNVTAFNGRPVNTTWRLFVRDDHSGYSGYLDEWSIRIYYSVNGQTFSIDAQVKNLVYGVDRDTDGYFETYRFDVCITANVNSGYATVYGEIHSNATGQDFPEAPWGLTATINDEHCFPFNETDFDGQVLGNTALDFTVGISDSSGGLLAENTGVVTLNGLPVYADYAPLVDTVGPKRGSGIGVLGNTIAGSSAEHVDSYYDDGTLGYFDDYILKDVTRRANQNVHGHNGQMASNAAIETSVLNPSETFALDADNAWNDSTQASAVDAHVNAAKVYDYLLSRFAINGFDDNGNTMASFVDVASISGEPCFNNALWDGLVVAYCAGSGQSSYAGALDVAAHEWAHAISDNVGSNLVYEKESGALDESFSDWFGTAVEHANGETNWTIGEGVNLLRDMSNPLLYSSPDTYKGAYWVETISCVPNETNDRCGVHRNSGVPNKMFYLLSNGGTQSNTGISVTGVGIQTAMNIAIDASRYYWTSTTDFYDARNGMVLAAQPYGENAVAQVKNAWAAVGVGDPALSFVDADNDGIADDLDNCPLVSNVAQLDTDNDTWGDACDAFISDPSDWIDTDLDGVGNNADLDDDGDGLSDSTETTLGTDPLLSDTDSDGVSDYLENAYGTDPLDELSFTPPSVGDINDDGQINVADLLLGQRILLGLRIPTSDEMAQLDLAPLIDGIPSSDGQITLGDLVILHRKIFGDI